MNRRLLPLLLALAGSLPLPAQEPILLVATNSTWRYFKGTAEPSPDNLAAWRAPGFAADDWSSGPAPFAYGEPAFAQGTPLTDMQNGYTTLYLRQTFSVANPGLVEALELAAVCDDGFLAWINGQPVAALRAPTGDPPYTALATENAPEPVAYQVYPVADPASVLMPGLNVLAVQVFNVSAGSSDLVFDAQLTATLRSTGPPTIAAVAPEPGPVTALEQVTVTFSEPVTGVAAEHFLVNDQPATSVEGGGRTYTFRFPTPAYGPVQIHWSTLQTIQDLETPPQRFDPAAAGSTWMYELLDPEGPSVAFRQPPAGLTVRALAQVEVTFNKPVLGVDAGDLRLNGVPAARVTGIGAGPYLFEFPPGTAPAGRAVVDWTPGHGIVSDTLEPHPYGGGAWEYTVDPAAARPDLRLTEFMAENFTAYRDEDADPEDWIEIFNAGTAPVNLLGWSLSRDREEPGQWVFPAVNLPAGGYLVVFASGKDRKPAAPGGRLHTNFKLNPNGGYLGLFGPELPRTAVSEVEYPTQGPDYSYGRERGDGPWRYFLPATPGARNATSTITGAVAEVHFSVERGFFNRPFNLALYCPTPGAVIRYTTDGSPPSLTNGVVYTEPVAITVTRTVRAAAFKTNALPSRITTHTYLMGQPAQRQRLPALSLVTASNHLYGAKGIMEPPNPRYRGPAWERPVSVEWIDPADNGGFQVDCGLRVQGGDYVRGNYNYKSGQLPFNKYSFRLYFRGEYGQGRLNRRLFPDTTQESFDTIVLRAGMNDPSNPFITDEVVRGLARDVGQPAPVGTFVNLYLNGVYKGYYNPCERIDVDFLRAYHGGGERWDFIAQGGEVREGDATAWNNLRNFATTQNLTNTANYLELARRLDLTNFVDYLCPLIYADNDDWPYNNWRVARERAPGAPFRFYVWDAEWAFGLQGHTPSWNTIANQLSTTSPPWGTADIARIFNALKRIPEFKLLFADRAHKHFFNGGALTDERIRARYNTIKARLNGTISGFNDRIGTTWIPQRRRYVLDHLLKAGLLASTNAPVFNLPAGRAPAGFALTLTNLRGTIWYTTNGADPRVMFTGEVAPDARAYDPARPLLLSHDVVLKARSLDGAEWSALTEAAYQVESLGVPVHFTELLYNPPGGDAYEFIELTNLGGTPVDLSGFSFEGIEYRFPEPFPPLAAGARLVLASAANTNAFATRYPGVAVAGWFKGALSNGGERLALYDRAGRLVASVEYDDAGAWPPEADGAGSSLEITDPAGDPDDPANWHASAIVGGTPGAPNSTPALPLVRLNEVFAVGTDNQNPDWIELFNAGPTPVNLAGWQLSGDGTNHFTFPANTVLAAGGYLRVWCDPGNTPPGLRSGFGLKRTGETLRLSDPQGRRMDAVTYGLQPAGFSVGRVGATATWQLTEPTPLGPNESAVLATASQVVINEFLANAPAGTDDWIEFYNRDPARPAALRGLWLATSNALQQITSLSFLAPTGFGVLKADANAGPDHLDFKLPAAGDTLVLYDATGQELQRLSYKNALEGVSQGLLPDGSGGLTQFPGSASPGAPNYVLTNTTLLLNEVLARAQTFRHPGATTAADWIELVNLHTNAVNLAGYSLSVGTAKPGQWTFPAGVSLPAGGYLVVDCDPARPASATATPPLNLGRALADRGTEVYLFDPNGALLDTVAFGFALPDQSIGRRDGAWQLLASPTPGAANAAPATLGDAAAVRLNEWLAETAGDDWIELYNPQRLPVDLGRYRLSDDPSQAGQTNHVIRPLTFIAPRGFAVWVADGNTNQGPDHVGFKLDGLGETLRLYDPFSGLVDSVDLLVQAPEVSEGRFPDGGTNLARFPDTPSPGTENYLPLSGVVVNEVLTHTDPPLEDAVELYNPGPAPVDLSGWYLSNSLEHWRKYRIPPGTVLPARAYRVFYEGQFNAPELGEAAFTLNSARGDEVYLSATDAAGEFTGWRAFARFGAAANGVSWGRHATSLDVDFVPLSARTFGVDQPGSVTEFRRGTGKPNAPPLVGPVVISEIMFQPATVRDGVPVELPEEEFVELHNPGPAPVALFDVNFPTNTWQLTDGVRFSFPPGAALPAGGYLVVVGFNPLTNAPALAAFRARYKLPEATPVFGPFSGRLANEGERLSLYRPDHPQLPPHPDAGFVPQLLVEALHYRPAPPWPAGAAGTGMSLHRLEPPAYANEPQHWRVSRPTPGRPAPGPGTDSDGDGLPDDWELAHGLDPDSALGEHGADSDPDGDGLNNRREFQFGTNPRAFSVRILALRVAGNRLYLTFNAAAGRAYRLESRPALGAGDWEVVTNVLPASTGDLEFWVQLTAGEPARFYRLVAP
jgi:hypothetical protein